MSSRVADSVRAEHFADSRATLRLEALEAAIDEESTWLQQVPCHIWERLSAHCETDARSMREECLHAGSVSATFRTRCLDAA